VCDGVVAGAGVGDFGWGSRSDGDPCMPRRLASRRSDFIVMSERSVKEHCASYVFDFY
jgi:hypothetical protein